MKILNLGNTWNFLFFVSAPFPPASINVSAGINSANISWQFNHSKSEVEYWFISVGRQIVKIPGNNTSFKIGNLSSGTDYNVTIWSFAASKNSSKKIRSIKTCKYIFYYTFCIYFLQ